MKMLSGLGRFTIDMATGFVVVTLLGIGLFPTAASAQLPPPMKNPDQPPPPPPPPANLEIIEMGIDKTNDTPPLLYGWGKFKGKANTDYTVVLLAAAVSGTNPVNEYTIVAKKTYTTDADGIGRVDATSLVGNAPLATSGWYVRFAIYEAGGGEELLTTPEWIGVVDE